MTAILSTTLGLVFVGLCSSCSEDNGSGSERPAQTASEQQQLSDEEMPIIRFTGICDGSAAVRIDGDKLLVAYDEQNSLYLFDQTGGKFREKIPYRKLLPAGKNDEADLEGATISGDSVWWIGSHGRDGDGTYAPNRHVLFQTDLPSLSKGKLVVLRKPVDLLPLLLDHEPLAPILTKSVMRKLPKSGGFNIEGVAANKDGSLMVALRSPVFQSEALIVRIKVTKNGFSPSDLHRIDLDQRGIRDILAVEDGFVVIAGAVGGGGKFALYHWSPASTPRLLMKLPADFNAEAVVAMSDHWLVLSDDGKVTRADSDARDGKRQCDRIYKKTSRRGDHKNVYFRAVRIPKE